MPDDYVARLAAMLERDQTVCVCGHKCISHGSYDWTGEYVGVGAGPCGCDPCPCPRFTEETT